LSNKKEPTKYPALRVKRVKDKTTPQTYTEEPKRGAIIRDAINSAAIKRPPSKNASNNITCGFKSLIFM
jgi:hypothetical protein